MLQRYLHILMDVHRSHWQRNELHHAQKLPGTTGSGNAPHDYSCAVKMLHITEQPARE